MAEFLVSQRGASHLLFEGHRYKKNGTGSAFNQPWRCVVTGCKGKAATSSTADTGSAVIVSGIHCHPPDPSQLEIKRAVAEVKHLARETSDAPRRIVSDVATNLSQEARGRATTKNLKRTIQRERIREGGYPRIPRLTRDLRLPDEYQTTSDGRRFLLYDNQLPNHDEEDASDSDDEDQRPPRILIFSSRRQLDILSRSSHAFFDGTFKVAPHLFHQLFTIHALHNGVCIPCAFCLMENKEQDTYEDVFRVLEQECRHWRPVTLMCDFELAAMNAFRNRFPDSSMTGCFFHLSQSIFRQAVDKGLKVPYAQDEMLRKHVKYLAALAFVPEANVFDVFEAIKDTDEFPEDDDGLIDLYSYFERTYLGRPLRRGRRAPRYPVNLWNMRDRLDERLPRTNNLIEAWHRGIQASLDGDHPSVWKCIDFLKKEEVLSRLLYEQIVAGQLGRKERNEVKAKSQRLRTLINRYDEMDPLEFLRGVTYNIDMNV